MKYTFLVVWRSDSGVDFCMFSALHLWPLAALLTLIYYLFITGHQCTQHFTDCTFTSIPALEELAISGSYLACILGPI